MKKTLLTAALMLLLALVAQSQTVPHYVYIPQYYPVPSGPLEPWRGHSLLALYAGTGFFSQPSSDSFSTTYYSALTPFNIAFRYSGEKDFSKKFFWGWLSEMSYYRYGYDYTCDGDSVVYHITESLTSVGHDVEQTEKLWTFSVEEGVLLGFNINRALSVHLTASLYFDVVSGHYSHIRYVNRTTGLVSGEGENDDFDASLFSTFGFTFRAEMRYFFSGPYFVSLAAKARLSAHSSSFDDPLGVNHYSLMLGVGYRAFYKKSTLADD
jgi:hypothetical protein